MQAIHDTYPLFLLTDFGTADPYVGQMKSVILTHAPLATIIDMTHEIRPFDICQAGFFLWAGYDYLPMGSVVLCVVDPGVGTDRRIVLLECKGRFVLAPDNGLTAMLISGSKDREKIRVFEILHTRDETRATFHGRDIFAPLGAQLINGSAPEVLGRPIEPASLVDPSWARARLQDNRLAVRVVHVDRFGNCLLNLEIAVWSPCLHRCRKIVLHPSGRSVALVRTYGDLKEGEVGLLAGSQGVFEIALCEADAARELGISPGDEIYCDLEG